MLKQSPFSPEKATISVTPKKNKELENLEEPMRADPKTMQLLEDLAVSSRRGLAPRMIQTVFDQIRRQNLDVTISCSYLIVRHENVIDLLPRGTETNGSFFQSLQIKESAPSNSPFKVQQGVVSVEGLARYEVESEWECLNLLRLGERNRLMQMAASDQRGHRCTTLFQLQLHGNTADKQGTFKQAKLNICDLAASDKVSAQEEIDARHLVDLRKIDLSVKTLEKVLKAVVTSQNARQPIPYRESKLTRILSDSLTQKTLVIATVSPQLEHIQETAATLQFV